jgi:hypothetical protein
MEAALKQLRLEGLPAVWGREEEAGREHREVVTLLGSLADQFPGQPSGPLPDRYGGTSLTRA